MNTEIIDHRPVVHELMDDAHPDADLVRRLLAGDEAAFCDIVTAWSGTMRHAARQWVTTAASADEVVQDTWLAVLRGLARFEGRSSLRTWVFHILVNRAKTHAVREHRTIPVASLGPETGDDDGLDARRFDESTGHWTLLGAPQSWEGDPDALALSGELRRQLRHALDELPGRQQAVVRLRDVQGCTSEEVCELLDLTPENQRVLLHRGRTKLRASLEDYYRAQ
jgi:RNA polymerase sigma-70 factor (ECF subfamily)